MASNMVDELFENRYTLKSAEALKVIHELFKEGLPLFNLVNVFDKKIHFGAEFKKNGAEVRFGGDRGYFEHKIVIDGQEYSLRQYEPEMINVRAASEKNYRFAFSVLKRFLAEKGII